MSKKSSLYLKASRNRSPSESTELSDPFPARLAIASSCFANSVLAAVGYTHLSEWKVARDPLTKAKLLLAESAAGSLQTTSLHQGVMNTRRMNSF